MKMREKRQDFMEIPTQTPKTRYTGERIQAKQNCKMLC